MRRLVGALALLLGACGPPPDFVTSRGTRVHSDGVSGWLGREVADDMEDKLGLKLRGAKGYSDRQFSACLSGSEVHLRPGRPPECGGECLGVAWPAERVSFVMAVGCPYQSMFMHEEAHVVMECVDGDSDPEHDDLALSGDGHRWGLIDDWDFYVDFGYCPPSISQE